MTRTYVVLFVFTMLLTIVVAVNGRNFAAGCCRPA
jgi:hypothetical protein